jgi:HAD superfamily, subfamily IIIB (Acid phosphatase)
MKFWRTPGLAAGAALAVMLAWGTAAPAQPGSQVPTGHEPPNLGLVERQVEMFYGDVVDSAGHHHASENSAWGRETAGVIAGAQRYLAERLDQGVRQPAVVLDVDDTSEVTFGWVADNQFDVASNEEAIDTDQFPAVGPTLGLAKWAAAHHVGVFFLTGRPEHQRAATLTDLVTDDGYPQPVALFMRTEPGMAPPSYLSCGTTCTTDQYKSQTRAHIEQLGYDVVLNVGDQFSDLSMGHEDRAVKLPDPMYFLP